MLRGFDVRTAHPAAGPVLLRKCACGGQASPLESECEGCAQKKLLRRAARDGRLDDVPASVDEALRAPGRPLDAPTRHDMETRFGHSFANVRLHDDAAAAESARAVDALAYSVGDHIVFGRGQYAPQSHAGQKLLAHELAHVTQQAPAAADGAASRLPAPAEERALEADADHRADHALSGDHGRAAPAATGAPGVLHRQAATPPANAPANAGGAAPAADPCRGATNVTQRNLGRAPGARFDATLARSACPHCALSLDMRVFFNFSNSVQPWPDQSTKDRYRNDFVRIVQDQWSNEYDFIPPAGGCAGEGCQRVSVGLNVIPVAPSGNPHWTVNVTYTDRFIRSSVSSPTHTGTFDSRDVTRETGDQYPVAHESGHMLGLGHTNCGLNGPYGGNINADSCYGPDDIMGAGSSTPVNEYSVFRETLAQLAPGCAWRPAITDARRRRNRITGGVVGGILGGLGGGLAGFGIGFAIGSRLGGIAGLVGGIIGGIAGAIAGAIGGAKAGARIGDRSRRTGEV